MRVSIWICAALKVTST